jgi:multiple sugar transport system permease protein
MARSHRVPWLFLAPHMSLFTIFVLGPVLAIFGLSLFDWNLLGHHRFAGLGNFQEIWHDRHFWRALANTLLFTAAIVPSTLAGGLLLALALNRRIPGRNGFRAAMYLPTVLSSVASGVVAVWLFDDHYGLINHLLAAIGIARIPWLSSTHFSMLTVLITTLWLRVGLCMVVYLAALQDVPKELLDAAALDGAGAWGRFRYVIWPQLRTSTSFLLVTNLIYGLHVFDVIFVMTGGGPAFSTTVLVQYIYSAAFDQQRQGYAAALSVVLFLVLSSLTALITFRRRALA